MIAATLLALVLPTAGVEVVDEAGADRVFVPLFRAGAGASPGQAEAMTDAFLEAARRLRPELNFVGAAELSEVLDREAERQIAGCEDDLSCLSELAGALDAPEVLSGTLARLGETWLLDLKRVDRGGATVRGQVQLKRAGAQVDALLDGLDGAVVDLFGAAPAADASVAAGSSSAPWLLIGGGLVAAAAGAGGFLWALDTAATARAGVPEPRHGELKTQGVVLESVSYSLWGLSAALLVGGGALLALE